jgi:hypothetical protein
MDRFDRVLNEALEVVLQFGPERARPAPERIRERLPHAPAAELDAALAQAHAVEDRAYALTAPGWPLGTLTDKEFRALSARALQALKVEFPSFTPDALSRALSQANYWHMRD